MANLLLKPEICEYNCKNFIFTENTGTYDATTNPLGWNSPTVNMSFATIATLDIYAPGNTTATPSLTIDLFATGNYPTITSTVEYTITNTALGISGRLTDGLWKFVYTVVVVDGSTTTYQQTIEKITSCNAKCCVDGLYGAIDDFECDCMDEAIKKAHDAAAIYKGMLSAAKCGKIDKFNRLKAILERLCNNTNCCS